MKGRYSFRIDSGKIIAGIALIVAAVCLILHFLGVDLPILGQVSLWQLILGAVCLIWGIKCLARLRIPEFFLPLTMLAYIFKRQISSVDALSKIGSVSFWWFVLTALLLYAGFSLLLPRRLRHGYTHDGENCVGVDNMHTHEKCLGSSTVYIDCTDFTQERIENSLGSCTVHFTNPEAYVGGAQLIIENSLGSITVLVPKTWHLIQNMENSLGTIDIPSEGDAGGKVLELIGETNLGSITVRYI